jgi:DNA-binding transcriptional LysR family regulator
MPENLIESRSATAMRWLVHHTDCIAISTSLVHRTELRSGEVVMVEVDWDFSTTKHDLYRRRRHAMSPEALALVDAIKAEARDSD